MPAHRDSRFARYVNTESIPLPSKSEFDYRVLIWANERQSIHCIPTFHVRDEGDTGIRDSEVSYLPRDGFQNGDRDIKVRRGKVRDRTLIDVI